MRWGNPRKVCGHSATPLLFGNERRASRQLGIRHKRPPRKARWQFGPTDQPADQFLINKVRNDTADKLSDLSVPYANVGAS